jgi:LPS-assembly lipoprotein
MSLFALAGCGFHLRTLDLGASVSSFYVESDAGNPLSGALRRSLRQAGVAEADSASAAEVVVDLLNAQLTRRSVSVAGDARVAEYEMDMSVLFRVLDSSGTELVAPRLVRSARVYRVDRGNIVGNSEEQALLEREMHNDLIQQIVRTLNAVAGSGANAHAA